jgi:RimK-like ATP-grasp domain
LSSVSRVIGVGGQFVCVMDSTVPVVTTRLLREACERRSVGFQEVDAYAFDYLPARRLQPGDMLYRPAVSIAAMRVEQFLFSPAVATFYSGDPAVVVDRSPLQFERAGLPVPPTVPCHSGARAPLRAIVLRLGGFPVVVKTAGGSRGIGVMRADSFPALFSLVDSLLTHHAELMLSAFVEDATHWRVVVVGDEAVAWHRNIKSPDDFRTYASTDPADFMPPVADGLLQLAVRAVDALHLEFGGVDILQTPDATLHLLESNMPCYFATPQVVAGVDVAGRMVEYLQAKANVLHRGRTLPS